MKIKNPAPGSCFLLELGEGTKIAYGNRTCSKKHYGIENTLPLSKLIIYNHTYVENKVYNIRFSGTDGLLNETVTSTIAITPNPCQINSVTLSNIAATRSSSTRILRSLSFTIRSQYDIKCQDASGALPAWDVYKHDGKDFVLHKKVTTTTSNLLLEPLTLPYGEYKVVLTLTLQGVKGVYLSCTGFFEVTKTPLVAKILQGSAMRRPANQPITLDGSESRDPDSNERSNTTMTYEWFCCDIPYKEINLNATALTSLACRNAACGNITQVCGNFKHAFPGSNSKSVVVPKSLFPEASSLLVKLRIQEGNREAIAFTVIQRVNKSIPSIEIRCVLFLFHFI